MSDYSDIPICTAGKCNCNSANDDELKPEIETHPNPFFVAMGITSIIGFIIIVLTSCLR